jgi:hypothetical protein
MMKAAIAVRDDLKGDYFYKKPPLPREWDHPSGGPDLGKIIPFKQIKRIEFISFS